MGYLVVAIHDVAPEWLDDIRFLTDALDEVAATPRVYKVIPEHLLSSPGLVAFLVSEQQRGSEIVMHGYSHRASGPVRGPLQRRLRASLLSPHAAEFLTLSPVEMEERLVAGKRILERAGLKADGFCAPGWLESRELRPILRRLGFGYSVGMTHLVDLQRGCRIRTDWVGYMGAGSIQERLVAVANGVNRLGAPMFSVLKCFLHPQGARESAACHRVLKLIPALMRDRTPTTYGRLVNQ